jgi:hypothetical protein
MFRRQGHQRYSSERQKPPSTFPSSVTGCMSDNLTSAAEAVITVIGRGLQAASAAAAATMVVVTRGTNATVDPRNNRARP